MGSGTKVFLSLSVFLLCLWLALRFLLPVLLPFLLGLCLALAAEPLVKLLTGPLRLPRGLGTGLGVSTAFLVLAGALMAVLALAVRQLSFLAAVLPDLAEATEAGLQLLRSWLLGLADRAPGSIRPLIREVLGDLFSGGTSFLRQLLQYILSLAGSLLSHIPDGALSLGTAVISGFMFSAKLPKLRSRMKLLLKSPWLARGWMLIRQMRTGVGRWLGAQLKLMGVTFLILTCGLILLAVPYAPLWALGISALDALPILGTGTALIPWAVTALLRGRRVLALGLLGTYVTTLVTRTVLEPRILGRQLGLDPLLTLMALYAGYRTFGIGGMILAPLATVAVLQILPEPEDSGP